MSVHGLALKVLQHAMGSGLARYSKPPTAAASELGISGETSTPPLLPFLCAAVKKWNRDTAIAAQSSTQDVWLACFKVRLFDDLLLLLLLNARHSNDHQCSHAMLPSSVPWWGQPISPAWPTAPKCWCLKSVCLRRPVGSCRHTEGIAAAIPVWVHAAPTARRLPVHSLTALALDWGTAAGQQAAASLGVCRASPWSRALWPMSGCGRCARTSSSCATRCWARSAATTCGTRCRRQLACACRPLPRTLQIGNQWHKGRCLWTPVWAEARPACLQGPTAARLQHGLAMSRPDQGACHAASLAIPPSLEGRALAAQPQSPHHVPASGQHGSGRQPCTAAPDEWMLCLKACIVLELH